MTTSALTTYLRYPHMAGLRRCIATPRYSQPTLSTTTTTLTTGSFPNCHLILDSPGFEHDFTPKCVHTCTVFVHTKKKSTTANRRGPQRGENEGDVLTLFDASSGCDLLFSPWNYFLSDSMTSPCLGSQVRYHNCACFSPRLDSKEALTYLNSACFPF
jgi:hypothetical protein